MSNDTQQSRLREQLTGRWQIPLLVIGLLLLVLGVWRMKPAAKEPTFDERFDQIVKLKEAHLYPEASDAAEMMLAEEVRTAEERQRLHRLMAEIIFAHELENMVHSEHNAKRILEHGKLSLAEGAKPDAELHRMQGMAWEWLQRYSQALAEYRAALAGGVADPWPLKKKVLEIEKRTQGLAADQLHGRYDEFVDGQGVAEELVYWAAEQKVDLYSLQDDYAACEKFLASIEGRFQTPEYRHGLEYLRALAWYHLGRLDDSERLLRNLRDQLPAGGPLHSAAGWLLGRLMLQQYAYEYALSFFDDVIEHGPQGRYRAASEWGRADALAGLERFDESKAAYLEAIRLAAEDPYGTMIDLREIREATTALYQNLRVRGRLLDARDYLRIADRLVRPGDTEAQARYTSWLASICMELGDHAMTRGRQAGDNDEQLKGRDYYSEAGGKYLELAKLLTMSEEAYTEAIRRAADAFDRAGERQRQIEVLDTFVRERPDNSFASEAMLRLGKTYQAIGEYTQAIESYQQTLIRYPRTPSAADALVPLAECFRSAGDLDKAEQTLLRIVDRKPSDPIKTITPEAHEYREALFLLGDLYMEKEAYEQAIARYTETLARYGRDKRADRVTFLLANAYRLSAVRIREKDLSDAKNVAYKDQLRRLYQERLVQAKGLFDAVIDRYRLRPAESMRKLDKLYVKLSWFYRADMVYDRSRVTETPDLSPFQESLEMYDKAAWRYKDDPMAMSAYIQMINCYLKIGKVDKARQMLARAHHVLKGISDEKFAEYSPLEDRVFWQEYLRWLEKTPVFADEELAQADPAVNR